MIARWRVVGIVAFLVVSGARADAAAPWVRPEPLRGAIVRGQVLTFQQEHRSEDERWFYTSAWLAPLRGEGIPKHLKGNPSDQGPPRWHIGHDACWVGLRTSQPLLTRLFDHFDRYELADFLRGQMVSGPGGKPDRSLGSCRFGGLPPTGRFRFHPCNFDSLVEYDYLSAAKDKARLFLLTNLGVGPDVPTWSFTVYACHKRWNKAKNRWEGRAWADEEEITVGFREPFQVLGKGRDYFFVTGSGQLYVSKPATKEDEPRPIERVWSDAARPIEALVTDADANRTFLFVGPANKGGRPAFFELSGRPRLLEYDPASVKPAKQGLERLRRILHYARVLVAHKKVKDK